jgi:uncharacterized protein (TIGR03435 family)
MKITFALTSIAAMVMATVLAAGQSRDVTRFAAASVKPAAGIPPQGGAASPDRFYRADITLLNLINYAFDMRAFRIQGGPGWISTTRWEVIAKAERAVTAGEMRRLVQRLLQDRFALRTHVETRDLPIYQLVMSREDRRLGPNIKPAQFDCEPFLAGLRPPREAPLDPVTKFPLCGAIVGVASGGATMRLHGHSMARFAPLLQTEVQRMVIDKSGLDGSFDIELKYQSESMPRLSGAPSQEGLPLFTALREQLGLRLEADRGQVEVLVIDQAEQPTPN